MIVKLVVGGALAATGFLVGKVMNRVGSDALIKLISDQWFFSTWGSIIGVGLASSTALICSIVLPVVVITALEKRGRNAEKPAAVQ